MIRTIIRVFQAVTAASLVGVPVVDVMNIIRRVQLRNTYWLEVIGLLIGFVAIFLRSVTRS